FEFHVLVDPIATYDYIALPKSPTISIVPGPGTKWFAILPTLVPAGERFRLAIKLDDKWGNPTNRIEQTVRLTGDGVLQGLPEILRLTEGRFGAVVDGLHASAPGDFVVHVLSESGEELCRSNP